MEDWRSLGSRGRDISYVFFFSFFAPALVFSRKRRDVCFSSFLLLCTTARASYADPFDATQVPYDKPQEALVLFNRWVRERKVGYA
jgi:hypothetical protein